MKTGIELIAEERHRQVNVEGWTPEHDDTHKYGELVEAALCYCVDWERNPKSPPPSWPWDLAWWKPSDDPIRNLTKAGALIAAEIDRRSCPTWATYCSGYCHERRPVQRIPRRAQGCGQ